MGVLEVIREAFVQARAIIKKEWDDFRAKRTNVQPRRDLN
jgi:hypothetical protein